MVIRILKHIQKSNLIKRLWNAILVRFIVSFLNDQNLVDAETIKLLNHQQQWSLLPWLLQPWSSQLW